MMLLRAFVLLVFADGAEAAASPAEQRIRALLQKAPGSVWVYAKNLDTGKTFGFREHERVRTASTIKLPIMVAVFGEVEAGRARWDERLVLRESEKVSGSGVLKEFSHGVEIPLRDLVHLMIVVSDNTATNLLLDRISAQTVNDYMDRYGFPQTRSMRKILGDRNQLKPVPSGHSQAGKLKENERFGIGSSTAWEMVTLLEKLEKGQLISPAASKEMIAILKRQQYQDGIARKLGDVPVASKSGALDALRSDVGIVYGPGGRVAMAITVDGLKKVDYSPDNEGLLFISELARLLLEHLRN
ncbi:MAG: class A beta-lactamase-related serine hydrolase [Bryobacteraceae bacterium]|nr:class A beta-lactamase-related serine hydrolase [Bryobacteraceae bacterium]MDW8377031.1 serine hydrolase [Bryobacterales bacterium]